MCLKCVFAHVLIKNVCCIKFQLCVLVCYRFTCTISFFLYITTKGAQTPSSLLSLAFCLCPWYLCCCCCWYQIKVTWLDLTCIIKNQSRSRLLNPPLNDLVMPWSTGCSSAVVFRGRNLSSTFLSLQVVWGGRAVIDEKASVTPRIPLYSSVRQLYTETLVTPCLAQFGVPCLQPFRKHLTSHPPRRKCETGF